MSTFHIGVVGCMRGGSLAEAFAAHPLCRIVALCDVRRERAERLASRYSGCEVYQDCDMMLEHRPLDIVCIATPDHTHAALSLRALETDKHVLSEIPMATTLEECFKLVEAVQKSGKKLQMGNEVRWFPYLEAVKKLADDGEFGEFFYAEAEYFHNLTMDEWRRKEEDGSPHWRWDPAQPQTTMLGGGPHAIDTMRWLLGGESFLEVQAYGNRKSILETDADDTTVAIFKGQSGVVAKAAVSYGMQRPYSLYFSLYGTQGSFESSRHAMEGEEARIYLNSIPYLSRMMRLPVPYADRPGLRAVGHGTSELLQASDLIDAILKDTQPSISVWEGARTCAAGICALESASLGGVKIEIPPF